MVTVVRTPLAILVAAATILTGPGIGLTQQIAAAEAPLVTAATPATEHTFGLGLADLAGTSPDQFLLFDASWSVDVAVALQGAPSPWGGAQANAPQQLVGLRGMGLGLRFGEETGPDGKRRLVFAPLHREWDDLSGWEKLGLALQYAGAAAAIGHFVAQAVK